MISTPFHKCATILTLVCITFLEGVHFSSAYGQSANFFPLPFILPTPKPHLATQSLELYSEIQDITHAEDRIVFAKAISEVNRRRWTNAKFIASKASNPIPKKIIDWIHMLQPGANIGFLERINFVDENPNWPSLRELRRRAEFAIDHTIPSTVLMTWFTSHPPLTTTGMFSYAIALKDIGNTEAAEELARRAWIEGLSGRDKEQMILKEFGKFFTAEDYWNRIDRLLYAGRISAARRSLKFISREYQLLARARIALITSRSGVDAAIARVPSQLQRDSGLLYNRVKWRRQRGLENEARKLIPRTLVKSSRPDLWWKERHILARDALSKGFVTEAYDIAKNHGADDAISVSEAEWLAGWIALRFLNDADTALPHFKKVYETVQMPVSLSRGAYWGGRALEDLGNIDIAQTWYLRAAEYPTRYYGQLAIGRLTQESLLPLPSDPLPTDAERESFKVNELTQVMSFLLHAGEKKHQRRFAQALSASNKLSSTRYLAAELMNRLARPDIGVWISRQAAREKITLLKYAFPVPFYDYTDSPEKAFVLATARQESNFDLSARSSAGARGLMQLMPSTARSTARNAGIKYIRSKLTVDPRYNIQLGSKYLNSLINSFGGSYLLASASYNAGPRRSRQWIRRFGDPRHPDVDPIDWVERIPFSETRNYVQRVLENLLVYRAILNFEKRVPNNLESVLSNKH